MGRHGRYGRRGEKEEETERRASATLVGAAVGTLGGPLWALVGVGAANLLTGNRRQTEWNQLNVSAALILILVNLAVFFMSLAVAGKCHGLGAAPGREYASALLLATPYVVFRAFSPCLQRRGPPLPSNAPVDARALAEALAPAAIVQIGGSRRRLGP